MRGVIEQARHSKSGKSLSVLIQNVWYTTKHFLLETKVGQEIVFDPKEITMGDGAKLQTIQAYTLANDTSAAPTPAAAPPPTRQVQASPNNPYQPLVSNLAAHLIAAGQTPEALKHWYAECVLMLEGKVKENNDDPDDHIPF
jgi:hypothetical protein